MTPNAEEGLTIRGRTFSRDDITTIRDILAQHPLDHRQALSKRVCEALDWYQENGRLKDRSCRDVLLRLERAGLIQLPPPRRKHYGRRPVRLTARSDPRLPFSVDPKEVTLDHFRVVAKAQTGNELWNELVERYHYLRFGVAVGPHIKYLVEVRGQPLACLAFGGAAWKVKPRDQWIGWTTDQRQRHLRLVVNNTRFLVLPWVRVKNLASRLLSLAVKRLPKDWERRYGYRPLLLETFVQTDRHKGTCYRAANWLLVGETTGRGKLDRYHQNDVPRKAMFVYPLVPDARRHFVDSPTPSPTR
jgi:Druantia protein DruA